MEEELKGSAKELTDDINSLNKKVSNFPVQGHQTRLRHSATVKVSGETIQ
jgi:hypothetical protein